MPTRSLLSGLLSLLLPASLPALPALELSTQPHPGSFVLAADGQAAPFLYSDQDHPGVLRALKDVQADLAQVSGAKPALDEGSALWPEAAVIAGTLGRSPLIDVMVKDGVLDASAIAGRWEHFLIQVVEHPRSGMRQALVVAGADKRGTLYGLYELSRAMGVSPWAWWADVPVPKRPALYAPAHTRLSAGPKVRYRGIFLNDEEPGLGRWAVANYGGFDHRFYERVFSLILRLKGNFLWPAMWWAAFNADDPESARLADEMGVVMSTSHHEPMMRAHAEWKKEGKGPWDYAKNEQELKEFWRQGIRRMGGKESVVTLAMRGDGDSAMSADTNIELLQRIVADQRRILEEETGRALTLTPQVWALYKEVQDYYDQGMRVPDDVTLLLSDDNWGNLRRLPPPGSAPRVGGYGLYYHFDYVGGPRNYKWLNTNSLPRVREQLELAWRHGVDRIWLVNVGDLKPMELPISFFLDQAWDPNGIDAAGVAAYEQAWAAQQFGATPSKAIAGLLADYGRLAARRKPELLDQGSYSLAGPSGWEQVLEEWGSLERRALAVEAKLAPEARDAYFQLVLHPILAFHNLHQLYGATARNHFYASQGRAEAAAQAEKARAFFARDKEIKARWDATAGGKWKRIMDQTHIGYTSWQQPDEDVLPELKSVTPRAGADADKEEPKGAVDKGSRVVLEAEQFSGQAEAGGVGWQVLPGLGHTLSGVLAVPVTAPSQAAGRGASLDYAFKTVRAGQARLTLTFSPTLDFLGLGHLRCAVSLDGGEPKVLDLWADKSLQAWERAVSDNALRPSLDLGLLAAGEHVLRYWRVDAGVVLQRLEIALDQPQ